MPVSYAFAVLVSLYNNKILNEPPHLQSLGSALTPLLITRTLVQNPDIVLVHYLNVPYPDDSKMMVTNSVSLWGEKKEWSKEELSSQLKPMCKFKYKF